MKMNKTKTKEILVMAEHRNWKTTYNVALHIATWNIFPKIWNLLFLYFYSNVNRSGPFYVRHFQIWPIYQEN